MKNKITTATNDTRFNFSAVVNFRITVAEASQLLAINDGVPSVSEWLSNHSPEFEPLDNYNAGQLKESMGKHLAKVKVEEARLLTMPVETKETKDEA